MRRVAALTLSATGILIAGLVAGGALALDLVRCYVNLIPLPLSEYPMCGSGLWGYEWVPAVVATGSVGVALLSLALLVLAVRSQFGRARRLLRQLEALEVAAPQRLVDSATRVGAQDYRCVRHPSPVAITIGVLAPRIVVSDTLVELLDDEELDAILAHEEQHRRSRDPAVFGSARMAAATAFIVPAARQLAARVVLAAEMSADSAAVATTGMPALVSAMMKLTDTAPDETAMAVGSARGMLPDRVEALAGRWEPSRLGIRTTLLSALGAVTVVVPALAVVLAYLRGRGLL